MEILAKLYAIKTEKNTLSVVPRTTALIVGPTGVGKTHLVRAFAERVGGTFVRVAVGSWAITHGRGVTLPTVTVIQDALDGTKGTVILQLDELDKIHSDTQASGWASAHLAETYDLLDQKNPRLFIVGTGTWQSIWRTRDKRMGFCVVNDRLDVMGAIRKASVIPPELLNRFSQLLVLAPMNREDYEAVIKFSGLDKLADSKGYKFDLEEAVESDMGMRWMETEATKLMML